MPSLMGTGTRSKVHNIKAPAQQHSYTDGSDRLGGNSYRGRGHGFKTAVIKAGDAMLAGYKPVSTQGNPIGLMRLDGTCDV